MRLHQRLADVQAETQARDMTRRGGGAIELVEDPWERVGSDSRPVILDADLDRGVECLAHDRMLMTPALYGAILEM